MKRKANDFYYSERRIIENQIIFNSNTTELMLLIENLNENIF